MTRNSPAFAKILVVATLALAGLQGCASDDRATADRLAGTASMHYELVPADNFLLTTYARIRDIGAPVTIYIEGEGHPLGIDDGDYPPAIDPSPDGAVGLRLAIEDRSPNVVYIARPCQFSPEDGTCDPEVLKKGRYLAQVLMSVNRAIDHYSLPFPQPRINLVGYSGGGAIAALIAARRHDIVSLRTIAGNLDPEGAMRAHDMEPVEEMLDPMPIASKLALIPQQHFVGDIDDVIPPASADTFVQAIGPSFCVSVTHVPTATHDTGWVEYWAQQARQIPACGPQGGFSTSNPIPYFIRKD